MRNYLSEMVYALTSAYDRKDYENLSQGISPQTNIGKLFSIFAWGLDFIHGQAELVKKWENIDYAQGSVLDRYGANFGVARGSANDTLYRLLIKAKMMAQLSGGEEEAMLKAVAEIFDTEYANIWLEDVFPAKKNLHVRRRDIPYDRLEMIGAIGYIVKRTMAAGVGLQMVVHLDPVLRNMGIGGKLADDARQAMPTVPDVLNFRHTAHLGGPLSAIQFHSLPQLEDTFDFRRTARLGGPLSSVQRYGLPQLKDDFRFERIARLGTGMSGIMVHAVPSIADRISFERGMYTGGAVSSVIQQAMPTIADRLIFERNVRTGGGFTRVSSVGVPIFAIDYFYPYTLTHFAKIGGVNSFIAKQQIPTLADELTFLRAVRSGGRSGKVVRQPIPVAPNIYYYDSMLERAMILGTGLASIQSRPVGVIPDNIRFSRDVGVGGAGSVAVSQYIPVAPNVFTLGMERTLWTGASGTVIFENALAQLQDNLRFERKVRTGTSVSLATTLPISIMPIVFTLDPAMNSVLWTGGGMTSTQIQPIKELPDDIRFSHTRKLRWSSSITQSLPVKVIPDEFDFSHVSRLGWAAGGVLQTRPLEAIRDDLSFAQRLRLGGAAGIIQTQPIKVIQDNLRFLRILGLGGAGAITQAYSLKEVQDNLRFLQTLGLGLDMSAIHAQSIPVAPNVYNFGQLEAMLAIERVKEQMIERLYYEEIIRTQSGSIIVPAGNPQSSQNNRQQTRTIIVPLPEIRN